MEEYYVEYSRKNRDGSYDEDERIPTLIKIPDAEHNIVGAVIELLGGHSRVQLRYYREAADSDFDKIQSYRKRERDRLKRERDRELE